MSVQSVTRMGTGQPWIAFLNPVAMARGLWAHRELIWQLAKRDVQGRYRAAQLGLLWSILTPLILLVIYTFVFSVILRAKWRLDGDETRGEFALTMFCGLLLYNVFAEVVGRAPTMVVSVPNYVKRVVFPLEVFVVSSLLSATFNMLIGYGVWLVGWFFIMGTWLPPTVIFFPLILVPVWLTTAGISWILASLGVFIRDVGYTVVLVLQMLFFLTPIFYRIEQIPERYRGILELNPLAHAVEDARRVLMWSQLPGWKWWLGTTVASALLSLVGYTFFMKSKRAFADVI